MIHLLTSPRTARTIRGLLGTVSAAVRSVINPAGLVADQAEPVEALEPAGLFTEDELPPVKDIERAALSYDLACDNARRADRGKRAAKRVLDKVPAGVYGRFRIFRTPSSRQTPDLAAITATYKRLGLGAVPMKQCAPSLKVELLDTAPVADEFAALAAV